MSNNNEINLAHRLGHSRVVCFYWNNINTSYFSSLFFVQRILCDSSTIISAHVLFAILSLRRLSIWYEIITALGVALRCSRLSWRPNTEIKNKSRYNLSIQKHALIQRNIRRTIVHWWTTEHMHKPSFGIWIQSEWFKMNVGVLSSLLGRLRPNWI